MRFREIWPAAAVLALALGGALRDGAEVEASAAWAPFDAEAILSGPAGADPLVRAALGARVGLSDLDAAHLRAVPGVGPRLSERIRRAIDRRGRSGGRFGPCDLETVAGVGPKLAARIRAYFAAGLPCPGSGTEERGAISAPGG